MRRSNPVAGTALPGSQRMGFGLVLMALIVSALAAGLVMSEPGPWVPAILGGGVFALLGSLIFIGRPLLAVFLGVLIVYFPRGIVPDLLHSLVFDIALALATAGLLLEALFNQRPIRWCATTVLLSLFLIWCVVVLMWTPDLVEARRQIIAYSLGTVLLFLLHNLVDSRERLDSLLRTLALGGWILLAAGFATIAISGYVPGTRLKIGDINENVVPTLLLAASAGVLWVSLHPRRMHRALAALLSFAYLAGALVLTALSGSRGGVLSFGVVLVLMVFARSTRRWTGVALCFLIAAAVTAPFLFTTAIERFQQSEAGELGGRDTLWYSGILLLSDYPFGAGLGNGKPIMPRYLYTLVSSEEFGVWTYRSTHNPVLDVGIDSGLPGMALYGGAVAAALVSFAASARRARTGADLLPRSYYAVTSFPFAGFFLSWIRDGGMNNHPALFIVLALLVLPARLFHDHNRNAARPRYSAPAALFQRRLLQHADERLTERS